MNNILEYNGYITKIEFNIEDKLLFGKIEGIVDLVTFESEDAKSIEEEFHKAVEDYLDFCNEIGKQPEKAYKGSFNIRIAPELHKEIAYCATRNGISLNQTVENAIAEYVKPKSNNMVELYGVLSNWTEVYGKSLDMWQKSEYKYLEPVKPKCFTLNVSPNRFSTIERSIIDDRLR